MKPKMKYFYPKVKSIDSDNRRITVCISKDEIDRHGERIEIQAIADALKLFASNSVVLGDHQHRLSSGKSSVIGHSDPDSFRVLDDEIDIDILFSITENAETYWINYRDGHQKAVSIGFIAHEWKHEDDGDKKVWVATRIELLEVSCVAVGANRGALIKEKDKFDALAENSNEKDNNILVALCEMLQQDISKLGGLFNQLKAATGKDFDNIRADLDEIKSLLITDPDGLAEGFVFGESSVQSAPAGDNVSAEQTVNVLKTGIQKFLKKE